MSESTREIEIWLENAVNMYQHNEKQKISKIAQEFNVPYQYLCSHLHGHSCQLNICPVNRTLDNSQEQALKDWIIHLDDTFCPNHTADPELRQCHSCLKPYRSYSTNPYGQQDMDLLLYEKAPSWIPTLQTKTYWSPTFWLRRSLKCGELVWAALEVD